jgi:hypothetical protein
MRSPAPGIQAAIAAAIGGGCGLLFLIGDRTLRTGSFGDLVPDAWIALLIGAFLGWWTWLLWRALKAERLTRYLAAAGFLVLATLIYVMQIPNLDRARRFHQEGLPTVGIVVGVFPHDHGLIGYRYVVDGVSYLGVDHALGSIKDVLVGDSIEVHFLRSTPSSSASLYPTETTRSVLFQSLFGALWLIGGGRDYPMSCEPTSDPFPASLDHSKGEAWHDMNGCTDMGAAP